MKTRDAKIPDAHDLIKSLMRYRTPASRSAVFELSITLAALFVGWTSMFLSLRIGYWLTLLLAIPTAGSLVRVFMIQHDCGHGAFFRQRFANDWTGRALGVLTLTPFDYWKRNHAVHHASSGNLDGRGIGDILTLTLSEYRARSWLGQFAYRVYRNPVFMFGVGPAYMFLLQHRLPIEQMRLGARPWVSVMATNAAIAAIVGAAMYFVGAKPVMAVQLPVMLLAASIGVWLFYVQHQFEGVHWSSGKRWTMPEAALFSSSHYDLPVILRWFTANIGLHHVHHLCSRIPYYRLRQVLRDYPALHSIGRVTLGQSFRSVRLALWDEGKLKLISFREARP